MAMKNAWVKPPMFNGDFTKQGLTEYLQIPMVRPAKPLRA
jgi:hypothetical protein